MICYKFGPQNVGKDIGALIWLGCIRESLFIIYLELFCGIVVNMKKIVYAKQSEVILHVIRNKSV